MLHAALAELKIHESFFQLWGTSWQARPTVSTIKRFFISLKTERTARKLYRIRKPVRADVFDGIERFYKPTRRCSTLDRGTAMLFKKA